MIPTYLVILFATLSSAQVTTQYTGSGNSPTTTALAPGETYTGLGAYDPTTLIPPAIPSASTAATLTLPTSVAAAQAQNQQVGIPQRGNFLGFSIELSVADVILGKNGEQLKPQFLNYMANIQVRAGQGPVIRVGGNTQEGSTIFADGLADGQELNKIRLVQGQYGVDTLSSPLVNYSPLLLYTMSNISTLVGAEWYFGLSFNQSSSESPSGNVPIAAEWAQKILGSNLRGLALGNEPDLYVDHGHRQSGWGLSNYITEFSSMAESILSSGSLAVQQALVGPSVCCQVAGFELADVFNAGFLNNSNSLAAVTVQHYPNNNCQVNGKVINAQDIFEEYLNHTSAVYQVSLYLEDSINTRAAGKELVMLEMNTASCGGFPGLSDSFGAAMWMTDYALQMAWANFSTALMHVGGQNVYYNPFTPPPSNLSNYQWTTGSVYYPTLFIAEAFGQSNASRVSDLTSSTDIYHPVYAIYENDVTTRFVAFNFVNDPTGANLYQFTLNGLDTGLTQVFVRYLLAPSISEQYNITWAGQTMGTSFESDGRLHGQPNTVTIACSNGACVIPVPAPAIALVFLSQQALTDSSPSTASGASAMQVTEVISGTTTVFSDTGKTFRTTVVGTGSATLDPAVLETSNGQNGGSMGSTSNQSAAKSAARRSVVPALGLGTILGVIGTLGMGCRTLM